MAVDRWRDVDRIFHEALALEPERRPAFLDTACAGDAGLRDEIASLLEYSTPAASFLEATALDETATALADDQAALIGRQIGDYRVVSRIGAGGMGDVYHARDLRLGRDVAMKVIMRSPLTDADALPLEREARAASLLNHPNIVTIYGVGADDDLDYIAMELVPGETLRTVMSRGPLPIEQALDIGLQLADALAAAHAGGLVHRDLKPDNIMVTPDGRVKILDFGIARRGRTAASTASATESNVSSGGAVIGTPGYMSPEQANGAAVGPAADQFAFGIILYEMLSGRRAFVRDPDASTREGIAPADVESLTRVNPAAPIAVRALIERCLQHVPEARFPDMGTVAAIMKSALAGARPGHMTRRRMIWWGAAAAVTAGVGLVWRTGRQPLRIDSLAVMPIQNIAGDPSIDYLSEGLSRALREALGRLSAIQVLTGRHPEAADGDAIARAMGRELVCDAVLNGSLTRRNGSIEVRIEVREAADGHVSWAQTYSGPAADMQRMRDAILGDLVDQALDLRVSAVDRRSLLGDQSRNAEAFDLLLRAFAAHKRGTEQDLLDERELLTQAVGLDRGYARAFVALASNYTVMAIEGFTAPAETTPYTNQYLHRALEIDPQLSDVYAESASYQFFCQWSWPEADLAWQTATTASFGRLQPDLLISRALQQWALGHTADALELVRAARKVDRLSPSFMTSEADYLLALDRLPEAAALYEAAIRADPSDPRAFFGIAEVHRQRNQPDLAIAASRLGHRAAGDEISDEVFAAARGRDGLQRIDVAGAELEYRLLERHGVLQYVSPLNLARVHARLGHSAAAFRHLEIALEEKSPGLVFLNVDPVWKNLRDAPQVRRVAKAVGLV